LLTATEQDAATDGETRTWQVGTRVAFRFCFVYFGLLCLTFARITFVYTGVLARWLPDHAVLWQMVLLDPVTRWVGRTIFGVDVTLNPDSGSGDQAAIWVLVFCLLVVAMAATLVWSIVDRRRTEYARLSAWFLVFLRLCVGGPADRHGAARFRWCLGVWVLLGCLPLNVQLWHEVGGGGPKPEFYGIWNVIEFRGDGKPRPPLATDETRWQRVVFDTPGVVTYQQMNGDPVDSVAAAGADGRASRRATRHDLTTASDVGRLRPAQPRLPLGAGAAVHRVVGQHAQSGSRTTGSKSAISPARDPDDCSVPLASASAIV
jgi:hypothetical protein